MKVTRTPGVRLTKKVVDGADLIRGRHYLWDVELKGFGLQVEPTGTRTYIVRYRPKGHGRDGVRRFYKIGRHGEVTAEQARAHAKRVLGAVADGQDPAADLRRRRSAEAQKKASITIRDLGELFLKEHIRPKRKPRTASSYESIFRSHIYPSIGCISPDDVTTEVLSRLHLKKQASGATANRALALVSSMYTFAARRKIVAEGFNPARGIEKYREQGRERYLTGEELQRLGATLIEAETVGVPWVIDEANPKAKHTPKHFRGQRQVADPYAVAAIRLLLFTGARLREILHLEWTHVDIERGLLFLPDSKTGKKTIVLNGAALDLLDSLKARAVLEFGRARGCVIKGLNEELPRADLKRPWEAIRRRAELDDVRLHDLRHTFASIGAGASLGLPIVGRLLGHSQPQTTARYAHLDTDPLRRAADIIGERLASALSGGGGVHK